MPSCGFFNPLSEPQRRGYTWNFPWPQGAGRSEQLKLQVETLGLDQVVGAGIGAARQAESIQSKVEREGDMLHKTYTTPAGERHASVRLTWRVDDAYEFAAWASGAPGETVIIGDGWGQREHSNTDRGATLPYIFRRRKGKAGQDTFVSVFAGAAQGNALVRGVKLPPPLAGAPKHAVARAVETTQGTDVILSQLETQALVLDSPLGRLTTDARAAVSRPRTAASSPARGCRAERSICPLATRSGRARSHPRRARAATPGSSSMASCPLLIRSSARPSSSRPTTVSSAATLFAMYAPMTPARASTPSSPTSASRRGRPRPGAS